MIDRQDTSRCLPTQADFDPYGGGLDALCAWENFGGLSNVEAYEKFCENPGYYQEDFMFMGGTAFSYYFPVVEQYIRESRVDAENDDEVEAMWILAHCIYQQFDHGNTRQIDHLRSRVVDLVAYVRNNLSQYCVGADEQQRIDTPWAELQSQLATSNNAG